MPALKRTKREVVAQFRCAEILGAARNIFARKGFDGATVDEVAAVAHVAKGTVYLYFPSKRAIYLEALRQARIRLIQETQRDLDAAQGVAGKIRAFIAAHVRCAEESSDFLCLHDAEFGKRPPASVNRGFRSLYLRQARVLEAVLRQACAQGQVRCPRPDAAAFTIYEMTRGLITRRLLGWSKASADEDVEFLCELIWKGLSAHEEAYDGR